MYFHRQNSLSTNVFTCKNYFISYLCTLKYVLFNPHLTRAWSRTSYMLINLLKENPVVRHEWEGIRMHVFLPQTCVLLFVGRIDALFKSSPHWFTGLTDSNMKHVDRYSLTLCACHQFASFCWVQTLASLV
jgi:hypothetical protein